MTFKTEINTIVSGLVAISDKFFQYEAGKKKALSDLRGNTLEEEMAMLDLDLKNTTSKYVASMTAAVNRMIEEVKAGNHYDINDPAVANAAMLLSNPGMDFDAAEAIIKGFAGNETVLRIIQAAAADEYQDLFRTWAFDNVGALESINSTINNLTYQSAGSFPSIISEVREKLTDFARRQNLDISTASDKLDEMRIKNICGLMGIDYELIKE